MSTIREILSMSVSDRLRQYKAVGIERVIIDGNIFTDYGAFSYIEEKSYVKSPIRSASGTIENLDSYAWFLTPHLKIDFGLMSIDSYRTLMNLIYSKNEFMVSCYDVVKNALVHHKMYFATEEMPKLWTIVDALNGNENAVMLLGVQDYTVEMIGTNSGVSTVSITYSLNPPISWSDDTTTVVNIPRNIAYPVGDNAIIEVTDPNDSTKKVPTRISNITFGDKYKFSYWCVNSNGTGIQYKDDQAVRFTSATVLYAIWEKSDK